MCHVFVRADKLSVVCVSDHEYPPRVAHTMMQRCGEDFAGQAGVTTNGATYPQKIIKIETFIILNNHFYAGQIDSSQWAGGEEVTGFNGQCEVYLERFQDPTKSDAMSRLQTDLDDTKIILVSCPSD